MIIDLSRYKKKETKLAKYEWQDYLSKVIKDFGVKKPYDLILWKMAKKNIVYLKGKVEYVREIVLSRKEKTQDYGAYLISIIKNK